MLTLIRDGGFSMIFILLFGGVALVTSFGFAIAPSPANERFISWMGLATLASILCGTCADVATVMHRVPQMDLEPDQRTRIVMQGLSESMAPGILGFAMLAIVALASAIGKRRLDARSQSRAARIERSEATNEPLD